MSRRWFLSLVVALGAVGVLIGATAASADFRGGTGEGELLDRVASILGIERTELDDAFVQAKSEVQDEKQTEALAALVEDGTLTGDEATEITEWLNSQPIAFDGLGPARKQAHKGKPGHPKPGAALPIPNISPEKLAAMVEADRLSQGDADAVQAWLDLRPDAVDKLVPDPLEAFGSFAPFGEGVSPFGGGGFYRFDEDRGSLDLDGLRERLEQFRNELPKFDGETPEFPGFNIPEGGFSQFGGDGFEFELEGVGPGFFFRGGRDGDGHGFRDFRGFGGFERFHDFTPRTDESTDDPEPVNL